MSSQNHCRFLGGSCCRKTLPEISPGYRVNSCWRFIEESYSRIPNHGHCHTHLSLVSTTQHSSLHLHVLFERKEIPIEVDGGVNILGGYSFELWEKLEVFKHCQFLVKRVVLGTHSYLLEDVHDAFVDFLFEELYTTISLGNSSCNNVEGGWLTSSIRSQQSKYLSLWNCERIVPDSNIAITIHLRQILYLYGCSLQALIFSIWSLEYLVLESFILRLEVFFAFKRKS